MWLSPPLAQAETLLESSLFYRIYVAFSVDQKAAQAWLPAPWKVVSVPKGPFNGANLYVVFDDKFIMQDGENKLDWETLGDDFARIPIRIDSQMGKGAGELASVTIENIPHGAVLTAGTEAHGSPEEVPIKDGAGIVVPNQITSLALTLASNSLDDLALRMLKKIEYSYPSTGYVVEKALAPVYLKLERGVFTEVRETGGEIKEGLIYT